jgi:hypothetical protein
MTITHKVRNFCLFLFAFLLLSCFNKAMTISELIERLEAFKKKHGDIEVIVADEYGSIPVTDLAVREYHDGLGGWHQGVLLS